jgi:hypothetical protein
MKVTAKEAIDYSSISNINQSIDKYRLVLIDIDTHRLSISSIKYAGWYIGRRMSIQKM